MTQRQPHARRRGLTLVEVVVSSAVMAGILLAVGLVTKTGDGVYQSTQMHSSMQLRAQRVIDSIADRITTSGKSTFTPTPTAPFGSSTLEFQTPTGMAGTSVTWGTKSRIQFQYTAADPDNGRDDDHDGFVDDGNVVLIRNVGAADSDTTVLATHVAEYLEGETANANDDNGNGLTDEKGLSFVLAGDQLTIRLTLAELDPEGQPVLITVQAVVRLRN